MSCCLSKLEDWLDDTESNSDEEQHAFRELSRLEDRAQRSCALALAKCAPVKNVKPDVCILYVDYSGNRHFAETGSTDSSGKRRRVGSASIEFHVLWPLLVEFSEYFRNSLKHDLHENRHNVVSVSEFDEEVTTVFVEFLYAGRVRDEIAHDLVCELARMGKYYQVTSIQQHCFAHLSMQSFENTLMKPVLDNLFANGFDLEELCDLGCCRRFLRQLRMIPSDYFKRAAESVEMDVDRAFLLLSRRELQQEAGCVRILRMRGWPTRIILGIGFTGDELRAGGVAPNPRLLFNSRNGDAMAMIEVFAARYPVKDLLEDGFTSSVIQDCVTNSHNEFRKYGYTDDQLRALGYTDRLLRRSAEYWAAMR